MWLLTAKQLTGVILLTLMANLLEAIIPVYTTCNGTITLDEFQPAAKLYISFAMTPYSRNSVLWNSMTMLSSLCSVKVKRRSSDYSIGALFLGNVPRKCPFRAGCQSCSVAHLKLKTDASTDEYCGFRESEKLNFEDSLIKTKTLTITWDRHYMGSGESYFIVLYSFNNDYFCPPRRTCNGPSRRCIPDKLICESPYKYCGDRSNLCPVLQSSTTKATTRNSNGGATTALYSCVGVGVFLVLFACVCCCYKDSCKTKAPGNAPVSNEQQTSSIQMTDRQRTYVYNTDVSASNAGFSNDTPLYDSLVNHSSVTMKDDLPPSYDTVMTHSQDYKVETSVNVYM